MSARFRRPRWAQHFLRDPQVLERIAASLRTRPGSLVVEIGPGRGALTERLLSRGARVLAVEIDERLVSELRDRFGESGALEVMHADVLDADLSELIGSRSPAPVPVTGNLPYYITSPILRRIFEAGEHVSQAVVLVQQEVAQRIVASKGTRDYAFLSVLCKLYAEAELLFRVPARSFQPPPKVNSALLRLTMRRTPPPEPEFLEFLKLCFSHPRKMLLNNLSGAYDRAALADLDICRRRAQQLDAGEMRALWKQLRRIPGQAPQR